MVFYREFNFSDMSGLEELLDELWEIDTCVAMDTVRNLRPFVRNGCENPLLTYSQFLYLEYKYITTRLKYLPRNEV